MSVFGSIVLSLATSTTRQPAIAAAGYRASSSAGKGPGSTHCRAAAGERITGMRSCTRIAAFASVMITV